MPSTLHVFRKHQKILMVMTTGLAMISFVILGAASTSRPEEMPAVLVVLALAAMFGGGAWVIGQVNGKSSEYLTVGAVAGAVLGLWLSWGRQDPAAIQMNSGDLTGREVFAMKRDRNLVNQFVGDAYQRVNGFNPSFAEQFGQRVFFHYTPGAYDSDVEMAITALLQREADRLGIGVSAQSVFEYIRSLAMTSGKSLTQEQFAEIRQRLGVSEEHLVDAIGNELKARRAYDLLYSQRPMPTPEALYEYYKKLNVTEEAEVAVLPIADFVDEKAEPTTKELEELFAKYKSNSPGYTAEGRFVEGQPGFRQPPRMKIAYLEAVYDTFEKQVGEVTDKEIEARYEELKKRPIEDPFNLPDLPGGLDLQPRPGTTPPPPAPPEGAKPEMTPESPKPETSAPAAPPAPMPEAPKPEAPQADAPKPEAPKTEPAPPATPEVKAPEEKGPAEKAPEATAPEVKAPESTESSPPPADKPSTMLPNLSKLSYVLFQDEQPPAPPVATGDQPPAAPAAANPQPEQPAAPPATEGAPAAPAAPATPAPPADQPATPPTDAGAAPKLPVPELPGADAAVTPPADPPLPTVRPLDDAYRAELKEQIIRERTQALMEKKIEEATRWVAEEISALVNTPPEDKAHLTHEQATKKLKEYATKSGLVYVETPLQSYQELQNSEDFPIGSAAAINHPQKADVVTDVFESFGRSLTYLPRPAAALSGDDQGSRFVYWITGEKRDYEPDSLSDELVKAQVIKAWRDINARKKAEERAAALVKLARESDKPLAELFSEQSVTGQPGTGYITVRPTGRFSWFRMPVVPTRSMQRESSPTLTELPGLKPLGNEFFTTVFETLKPGEVGVASSGDKSDVYVVKVLDRTPSTPEELEAFRQTFLTRGLSNEYFDLASRDWAMYGKDAINDLLRKNDVRFTRSDEDSPGS